ncbi:hypothetical protein IscW_ISCW004313 [Ixodes scapularis]|uniref:Adenylate cyclase conserved domain-containing protein n=1 Tax=Ixodes scapularis TaxID=6945 RepID=B7PER0_IXOSC|nr:hypothetical protein IscW_ISCW004313 [Ixodes scapularis]|eukprot:XP_002433682.1 hypothetical protein IscW_ISCW004313 [Ixodes scapularis]
MPWVTRTPSSLASARPEIRTSGSRTSRPSSSNEPSRQPTKSNPEDRQSVASGVLSNGANSDHRSSASTNSTVGAHSEEDGPTVEWTPEIPFENLDNLVAFAEDDNLEDGDSVSVGGTGPENSSSEYRRSSKDEVRGSMREHVALAASISEDVDDIIDHEIELESNKKMRRENVNQFTLAFKCQLTENLVREKSLQFKS